MPQISLNTTIANASKAITRLNLFYDATLSCTPEIRIFAAELILLRLFSIFEHTNAEVATKLCAGANYLNGTAPKIKYAANSIDDAKRRILTHNRGKHPLLYIKWTMLKDILKNLQHSMDINDPFINKFKIHNSTIEEMRHLRNHAAHMSASTRKEYNNIIRNIYGAKSKVQLGVFLTSGARVTPPKIEQYFTVTRIILNDLASG